MNLTKEIDVGKNNLKNCRKIDKNSCLKGSIIKGTQLRTTKQ